MKFIITNPDLLEYRSKAIVVYILGGIRFTDLSRLRVTLKLVTNGATVFPMRYSVDLYSQDALEKLIRRSSEHFSIEITEVRKLIMGLIEELENYRVEKSKEYYKPKKEPVELTPEQVRQATKYLKGKNLMQRTMAGIGKAGIINEEINRLLMYLVFTSRKLNNPLHIITLGQSGSGKSHLQNKVSELMPPEEVINITSLSKNSLYYFQPTELQHTLIAIEDLDGATEESLYAIRELQSRKQLSKTIATKDAKGIIKTETITINGIVCIAATTTREKIYNDNSNRSILINIDTSLEQDKAIIAYQKKVAQGLIDKQAEQIQIDLFRNVQRVLKKIRIVNPYASKLSLPDSVYNPRRTMAIYLGLIEVITFYHQYQRETKTDAGKNKYIESTKEDIAWSNMLLKDVLLDKSDDISNASRGTLESIRKHIGSERLFTSKEVRKVLRMSPTTLKRHLKELELTGYVKVKGNRYLGYEYRLLEDNWDEVKKMIERFARPLVVHT